MYVYMCIGRGEGKGEGEDGKEKETDRQTQGVARCMWRSGDSFHPSAVSRDRTPDVRFGRGYLCLLSHLTGPEKESTFSSALSCLDGHVIVS